MHTDQSSQSSASKLPLKKGQQFGGCFILREEISQDFRGPLWVAQDEVMGKEVSLHFIPPAVVQDARAMEDLRQEVKRNRQLIHPNILRVYDLVEDGGLAAIAMDRFEGETLLAILQREGVLNVEIAEPWLRQVLETLGDAHRIHLFHRDLAPANIVVRPNGKVLITYFGLSRILCEALERAGVVKGENAHLRYVSPQQLDGERLKPADDLYGFGALAYELFSGRPVLSGANLVAAIRKAAPLPLNQARAMVGEGGMPGEWEPVVAACLSKGRESRPHSCGEVLASLKGPKTVVPPPVPASPVVAVEKSALPGKVPVSATKATVPPQEEAEPAPSILQFPHSSKPRPKAAGPVFGTSYPGPERSRTKLALVGLGVAVAILVIALVFREDEPAAAAPPAGAVVDVPPADAPPAPNPEAGPVPETPNGAVAAAAAPSDAGTPNPANPAAPNAPSLEGAPAPTGGNTSEPAGAAAAANAGSSNPPSTKTQEPMREEEIPIPEPPKLDEALVVVPAPTVPEPLAKVTIPRGVSAEALTEMLAERRAALAQYEAAADEAEKAREANAQRQESVRNWLAQYRGELELKKQQLGPSIEVATSFEMARKQAEERSEKAAAAAQEAIAQAEAARKALDELMSGSDLEKVEAGKQAQRQIAPLAQAVDEGTKRHDSLAEEASKAEGQRRQMLAAKRQMESDIQAITAAYAKANKSASEVMMKVNRPKIQELNGQVDELSKQLEKLQGAVYSLKVLNDDSTSEPLRRLKEKVAIAKEQKAALQDEIKRLSGLLPPLPPTAASESTPPKPAPTLNLDDVPKVKPEDTEPPVPEED